MCNNNKKYISTLLKRTNDLDFFIYNTKRLRNDLPKLPSGFGSPRSLHAIDFS